MKLVSYYSIGCIFIFLLQAMSSDMDRKQWSFSFPKSIKVLKNADVTIPCTFTAPDNQSEVNLIWFKYHYKDYLQIFNNEDPSSVIEEYRGRTTLVNGTNSCTLRIKDVTETAEFYPGINKEINSFHLNKGQKVEMKVTGCSEDGSCHKWNFDVPVYVEALKGSCVDIPCTFTLPKDAKDYNFFWYLQNQAKIFNNKTRSDVADEYRGRTFLTGNTENDCSIMITNVENYGEYFPGINTDINYRTLKNKKVTVYAEEKPPKLSITGTENMRDKKTVNISCSVNHTCPSNPPTITWNITGHPVIERHKNLRFLRMWMMKSIMTYTSSYTDDKTVLECAATFPNNKTYVKQMTLNIKYPPKNITISIVGNKNTQEDDDVTLLCSCQANPPVTNYSWYQIVKGGNIFLEHGDTISVKNTTTGKYICAATNEMGTEESREFKTTGEAGRGNSMLYAGIGTAVGLLFIFVLIVIFCRYRRKRKSSVLKVNNVEETGKLANSNSDFQYETKTSLTDLKIPELQSQEEIPMDDHLYGNIDQQQRVIPRQNSSELEDSAHIYNNTGEEKSNIISKTEEEQTADSDGVLYTLLELSAPRQELQCPRTPVETEYATLKH